MLSHASRVQCSAMLTSGSFFQPFGNTSYRRRNCVLVVHVYQWVNVSIGWQDAWEAMFDQGQSL